MTQSYLVPFYGDKLNLVDNDGQAFVAVKPICDRLGLAWQVQHRKLQSEKSFWGVTIMVIPSAGGLQESICIPARKIFAWLMSISPSKVADKVRPVLERYQAECDRVLEAFWTGKLSDAALHWKHQADSLAAELFTRKPIYARVLLLAQCGYDFIAIWKGTSYSQAKVADALRFVVQMGRLPDLPEGTPAIVPPKVSKPRNPKQPGFDFGDAL